MIKSNFIKSLMGKLLLIAAVIFICGCQDENIKVMFENYENAGGHLEELRSAAVLKFTGDNNGCTDVITSMVADHIRSLGYMTVMDPDRAMGILQKKGLPYGGVLSTDDATSVAEALGVDALVYGTADGYFNSEVRYYDYYDYVPSYYYGGRRWYRYYRQYYRIPYLNRSGRVTLDVHFYDAIIEKEMGSIKLDKSYSHDYKDFYYNDLSLRTYFFDNLQRIPMPTDRDMIPIISNYLLDKMMSAFTPFYVMRIRTPFNDIDGADLIKQDKWDQAKSVWVKLLADNPPSWKAAVNLGVYYERKGNPERAYSYYKEALAINPGDPTIEEYLIQTGRAKEARLALMPLDIDPEEVKYKVADVKSDGRIYITAGEEDRIKPGDKFTIARIKVEFENDLATPKKARLFPIGTIVLDKVFEGVSWGSSVNAQFNDKPRTGDAAILQVKPTPEEEAPDSATNHLNEDLSN